MANTFERRFFLQALPALPFLSLPQTSSSARAQFVGAGQDLAGKPIAHGFSALTYKVSAQETGGGLFIMEHVNLTKGGGPPRHLHHEQEEWFYLLEGEMIVEIGTERTRLKAGDCVLAPRGIPHAYVYVSGKPGRLLIAFTPAGKMEAFFRDERPHDASLFRAYGMELVGSPMSPE